MHRALALKMSLRLEQATNYTSFGSRDFHETRAIDLIGKFIDKLTYKWHTLIIDLKFVDFTLIPKLYLTYTTIP